MQPTNEVAVTIANNLPAILTALAPIIASIGGLVIAYFNLRAKLAETRAATNKLIEVTKALRDNAKHTTGVKKLSKTLSDDIPRMAPPEIPEVPELLE